jgi:transposase InsO family protein
MLLTVCAKETVTGISRVTGYKIFNRYKECGLNALNDRSRAPYRQSRRLPAAIRTDNRTPFASGNALFGLSRLAVWWLRLGINIQRIKPGHPQQNGRHERMHLTLKKVTFEMRVVSFSVARHPTYRSTASHHRRSYAGAVDAARSASRRRRASPVSTSACPAEPG